MAWGRKYPKNEPVKIMTMDSVDNHGRYQNILAHRALADELEEDILNYFPNQPSSSTQFWKPEWLKKNVIDIITDNTTIKVSYIKEEAGFKNCFGYIIYNTNAPPRNIKDLKRWIVTFPNLSHNQGTFAGDTVQLASDWTENNDNTITPTSYTFSAGTSVMFFIIANGWTGNKINDRRYKFYSNPKFNPESTDDLKQHCAVIRSTADENSFIIGFEDINRERPNCDHDMNDCIILVTVNDYKNIDDDFYISATEDDEETINYKGTLIFEDIAGGVSREDVDYNDIVAEYHISELVETSTNLIKKIEMNWSLKHRGASYDHDMWCYIHNENTLLTIQEYIDEKLGDKEIYESWGANKIPVFRSTKRLLSQGNTNTNWELSPQTPTVVRTVLDFSVPVTRTFGYPPYNIIIQVNKRDTYYSHIKYPTYAPIYTNKGINEVYKMYIMKDFLSFKSMYEKRPLHKVYYRFINYILENGSDKYWFEDPKYHQLRGNYLNAPKGISWE